MSVCFEDGKGRRKLDFILSLPEDFVFSRFASRSPQAGCSIGLRGLVPVNDKNKVFADRLPLQGTTKSPFCMLFWGLNGSF